MLRCLPSCWPRLARRTADHQYAGQIQWSRETLAYDAFVKFVVKEQAERTLALARLKLSLSDRLLDSEVVSNPCDIKRSTSRYTEIDLKYIGKSVDDIDVALPMKLKTDLADLALKYRLTSSSYVRKMLVLQLLGEQVHTSWQDAVGAISNDVLTLEKD